MKWFHNKILAIGNAQEARDNSLLYSESIVAIVDLAMEEKPATPPRELIYCRIPLQDGSGNSHTSLRLAIATISKLVQNDVRTLVCCSAGISRSPSIVACVLALLEDTSLDQSLTMIHETCSTDVSPDLWQEIKRDQASNR